MSNKFLTKFLTKQRAQRAAEKRILRDIELTDPDRCNNFPTFKTITLPIIKEFPKHPDLRTIILSNPLSNK